MKRADRPGDIYTFIAGDACIYCGVVAEVLDHAYPMAREPSLAPPGMMLLVPACAECNSMATNEVHRSIDERRAYIHRRLRERNKSLLNTPEWDDDELAELEGRLRESVLTSLEAKRRLLLRLSYRSEDREDNE
jgi:hypothetical protein